MFSMNKIHWKLEVLKANPRLDDSGIHAVVKVNC